MLVSTPAGSPGRTDRRKVETAQQFDMVSALGVQLFQGYLFARPRWCRPGSCPRQASIVQLLNLLRGQASTDAIEEVLKKDAGRPST